MIKLLNKNVPKSVASLFYLKKIEKGEQMKTKLRRKGNDKDKNGD